MAPHCRMQPRGLAGNPLAGPVAAPPAEAAAVGAAAGAGGGELQLVQQQLVQPTQMMKMVLAMRLRRRWRGLRGARARR